MADYRQECSNPSCSYNGFSGHSPDCPVPGQIRQAEDERKAAKAAVEQERYDVINSLTDDALLEYTRLVENKVYEAREVEFLHLPFWETARAVIRQRALDTKYKEFKKNREQP